MLLNSLTSVTGLSTRTHNGNALQTNVFPTVATLKNAIQPKSKCMQRFPFSSEFGQKIRKCSLHTRAPHFRHTNLQPRLFSMQWTAHLAAFSCRQWFIVLRRLSLMSIHDMLTYCRCWTAWREATSCCVARPRCFCHTEMFNLIFKNENSCTDLCIWNPLEMVAGSGVLQNPAVLNDNNWNKFLITVEFA